jgi:UDP-N-acetylglucosamine diphosphorylase / glucose-1-phosphate thymidylyltransferase / UDP-N-acetylgalactosamine diphosphorylase / glucosamine-1-phosphate N-acetyltransferase / galactosamine-1-phosphate N-acetyltransferase
MAMTVESLFGSAVLDAFPIFHGLRFPWEALSKIKAFILEYGPQLPEDYERIDEFVWVGQGTVIEKSVLIKGPAIIGRNCELRHSAFIRDNVLMGDQVVVGNSTEIKNSILMTRAQAPHFNYVGDSILGFKAHIGAGVILSNLKSDGSTVRVKHNNETIETGLRKFGAILGDNVEVGCNSVLNPGTVIGKNSTVYPLSSVRGVIPENSIYKSGGQITAKR